MSVYKELWRTAEQIEKQSKRIYPDACDYGIPIFSNTDELIMMVKQCVDMYDGKVTTESYGTGSTQTIIIEGYDEWVTKKPVTFTFTYTFIKEQHREREHKKMIGILELVKRSDREVNTNC